MAAFRTRHLQGEPKVNDVTIGEAFESLNRPWVHEFERNNIPIRDVLSGRVWISKFSESSQLEIIIHQIHLFMDKERENWSRGKKRYLRHEKVFAKNLFNVIVTVERNLVQNLGVKPPIDRENYLKLRLCYDFDPFVSYWTAKQRRQAKRMMWSIIHYYQHFNKFEQEVLRKMIDKDDKLIVQKD